MQKHILVARTKEPNLYAVTITDLDPHGLAGDTREILGIYPRDVANLNAMEEGKRRNLPVIVAPP